MCRLLSFASLLGLGGAALAAPEVLTVPPREAPAARDALMPADAVRRFDSVRLRHPGGISGSALSPDGKLLATASRHSVAVWDLATDTAVRRFDTGPHNHYATQKLAFSPDGRRLAA